MAPLLSSTERHQRVQLVVTAERIACGCSLDPRPLHRGGGAGGGGGGSRDDGVGQQQRKEWVPSS